MVSVGHRTAFNEHLFGEPEQDANTALTELDKGNYNYSNIIIKPQEDMIKIEHTPYSSLLFYRTKICEDRRTM